MGGTSYRARDATAACEESNDSSGGVRKLVACLKLFAVRWNPRYENVHFWHARQLRLLRCKGLVTKLSKPITSLISTMSILLLVAHRQPPQHASVCGIFLVLHRTREVFSYHSTLGLIHALTVQRYRMLLFFLLSRQIFYNSSSATIQHSPKNQANSSNERTTPPI